MHTSDLGRLSSDVIVITLPVQADTDYREQARTIALFAPGDVYVGGYLMRDGCDEERLYRLSHEAAADDLGFVALGHVLYHRPDRRPLADVLSCIRQKTSLPEAGWLLSRNAEHVICWPPMRWRAAGRVMKTRWKQQMLSRRPAGSALMICAMTIRHMKAALAAAQWMS